MINSALLDQWLGQLLGHDSEDRLVKAYKALSQRYQQPNYTPGFQNETEVKAYAAARMPATNATVSYALTKIPDEFSPESILDLGAGTGAASLAALMHFPGIRQLKLVEQDKNALAAAGKLLESLGKSVELCHENLKDITITQPVDLVIFSYVLNELQSEEQQKILEQILAGNHSYILIVMPGTPLCFKQLLVLRDLAISSKYGVEAPCSHQQSCPMAKDPWCHFKVRLPRTRLHRVFKEAALNFEDEKFCYLLLTRNQILPQAPRIVKKPIHRSGHSIFDICAPEKLERVIIGRKDKGFYKKASKLEWGDTLPDES